ncbi:S-DNA-T family DNA segregation ATPase FtsK/SpoIIIE [Crossiella equi]|uniref:S-DNA-T family DNA segregation ATPase FtsK/SpoIIIE n=1 Tax=Crossiella equi TaxID=130796 RepID=A0ABS5ABR3_9PSEU|nr:FtsK/SpoIIIE domain-containing protein [Crossiella equi]MBP2474011.1 S-DNA-T family DNA segregation ATPase FtsK/SpoIIIE [Crossiella equi]
MAKKTEKTTRTQGREFQALVWAARHPGISSVPLGLSASLYQFGGSATLTAAGSFLGGTAAVLGGWYRAHPGTYDAYAAPVLRACRRRWVGPYTGRRWRDLMDVADLVMEHRRTGALHYPRVRRVTAESPHLDAVTVKLPRGLTVRKVTEAAEVLASALQVPRVAVDTPRPGVVTLIVQRSEPFGHVIPAPDMPADSVDVDLKSIYVGEDEYGNDWYRPLDGTHTFVAGATGAGKNSVITATLRSIAPLIRDGLVRLWVCDPKQLEFAWLRELVGPGRYGDDPDSCAEVIEAFVADMAKAQKRMQRNKTRSVPVSREFPLNWLIVDEIGSLLAYNPMRARDILGWLGQITSTGRVTHHVVDAYVQEPSKDVVPIRDLFPTRLCLRVSSANHPDMTLGEGCRARGAIADEIPNVPETAGIGFLREERSRRILQVRAAYTDDAGLDELVAFIKGTGPGLRAVA